MDDVVIMKDESLPRNAWPLEPVSAVYPVAHGQVGKVQVVLADSCLDFKGKRTGQLRYFDRPIHKLVLLMQVES